MSCQWQNLSFQAKMRILENFYLPPGEPDSLPILKDFSDETGNDINECNFLNLSNEMCQHVKDLRNSMNQCFPKDQCTMS